MRELAERAVEGVRRAASASDATAAELSVLLREFSDVQVVDATSLLLKKLARHWAPSTSQSRPAGIMWHTVLSLGDGLPVDERLTDARTHDTCGLPEGALEPGTLTLLDLGYLDVARFIDAIERHAHFVTRLKTGHSPRIRRVHVGRGERVKARGMRLDEALNAGVLLDESNRPAAGVRS